MDDLHEPVPSPCWFRGKDMTGKLDAIEAGGRLVLNEPLSAAWMGIDSRMWSVACKHQAFLGSTLDS